MTLSEEAAVYFERKHGQVELFPTSKALQVWNKASGTVIGLYHATC